MFRDGKSIEEIARARDLTVTTVEGHLALFIPTGKIQLEELVDEAKIPVIRDAVARHGENSQLAPIKADLGDGYSYGEIRAVMAAMQ
jgi:ATP-dependent DNA helicase RecQ